MSGRALNPKRPHLTHPSRIPVLKSVVHDGLQHQTVPNLGRAPEVEHLNGLQRRVGMAQPAGRGGGQGDRTNASSASATGFGQPSPAAPIPRPSPEPHVPPSGPPTPTQPSDSSAQRKRTKVQYHSLEY